jgi:sarcosine oxidase subunit delta
MRLTCLYCGPRALAEFEFRRTLPPETSNPVAREYLRRAAKDYSVEHWQHTGGCRDWLLIVRNPSTDELLEVLLLAEVPK